MSGDKRRSELIARIREIHSSIESRIISRLHLFSRIWNQASEEELFSELVFCLLTPQSSALRCGRAVELLHERNLILAGSAEEISRELCIVRFRNNKARYIIGARKLFTKRGKIAVREFLEGCGDVHAQRQHLASCVKGMGVKESSHFLRNIGLGGDLAILDRHILRNLAALGVISDIPASLPIKKYSDIEKRMRDFAEEIRIPQSHLDFVLWYKEAGEVYK